MHRTMRVRPFNSVVWIGAAGLLAVIGFFAFTGWTDRTTDAVTKTKQPGFDAGNEERAVTPQEAVALPSNGKPAPQVRIDSRSASDPRVWQSERALFLSDKGFAASIQQALSNPSAARLFYAIQAVDRCSDLRALGGLDGSSAAGRDGPEFVTLVATCQEALALNNNQLEFFAKLRSARLGPADQSILDAVNGKGSSEGSTMAQRFAIVASTDDPLLLREVGVSWLRSRDASYAGTRLTDDSRAIFQEAWGLAACEATASCETSIGSFRLCATQQQCDRPLRSRLQSLLPKDDYETLIAYTNAIASSLRSKDFSAFN
jgi:hypothetical protein